MSGSTGIFRNNDAESHFPEIYGTFNVRDDDGTEYTGIKCTIFLDGNETVVSATCEDANGATIDTSNSTTCQFDSGS